MCFFLLLLMGVGVTSPSVAGNLGHLTWVRHCSHNSSATHSYQCVQYFPVSNNGGCESLGFLVCTQMLRHAIAHRGCTDTVRVYTES